MSDTDENSQRHDSVETGLVLTPDHQLGMKCVNHFNISVINESERVHRRKLLKMASSL
jgi:hypothetical protein